MIYKNFTRLFFLSSMLMAGSKLFSQGVGINNTGTKADASAMLDVSSTNKGMLVPRVALQGVNDAGTISLPAYSLLVFNTNAAMPEGAGYYYNTNTPQLPIWQKLSINDQTAGWLTTGNDNLTDLAFMGTLNSVDVIFKRQNIESFRITTGGALLATGNPVVGVTPSAGAGTKMMWIPSLGAFRAGKVDGAQWDHANVGLYSFAAGFNTAASNTGSVAFGVSSLANGDYAFVTGLESKAIAQGAIAMGSSNYSTGAHAITMGFQDTASGISAIAMGQQNVSSGDRSVTIGSDNKATHHVAVAIGRQNSASADQAIALGYNTIAAGISSLSMGNSTFASGNASTAMGSVTLAGGENSIAAGRETKANGFCSIAAGSQTQATGMFSAALGENTIANARASLAIGFFNEIEGINPNVFNRKLFQIGNGAGENSRNDVFFVRSNGNGYIAGALTQGSDIRLKKDIVPLSNVLGKIANIQPITYNFIDTKLRPATHQIGFSAQEVQQQFPELVSENDNGYLGINYMNMTAVAIQAVKEQQEQIAALQQKVSQQEVIIKGQEAINKDLQTQIQELKDLIKNKE